MPNSVAWHEFYAAPMLLRVFSFCNPRTNSSSVIDIVVISYKMHHTYESAPYTRSCEMTVHTRPHAPTIGFAHTTA